MRDAFVLDTSAVLAVSFREPGGDRVREVGDQSVVSTVNASEVWAKLIDKQVPADELADAYAALEMKLVSFDARQAEIAGRLRTATRGFGLSLGDRACLALAIARKLPVMTADRAWSGLGLGVDVEVIR